MTRPGTRTASLCRTGSDLEGWLLDEPELDAAGIALLGAYRDAADAARKAFAQTAVPQTAVPAEPVEGESAAESLAIRQQPTVLRLRSVPGVEEGRLAGLHG